MGSALGGFTQRPDRTKAFGLAAVRRFAQRRPQYPTGRSANQSIGPSITDHRQLAKFPANSLLCVENSLLGVQKFPAPLLMEFACNPLNSLPEWSLNLPNTPK